MCDVQEYERMAREMSKLSPSEVDQIIMESGEPWIRKFYSIVGDFFMQEKQKEYIQKEQY